MMRSCHPPFGYIYSRQDAHITWIQHVKILLALIIIENTLNYCLYYCQNFVTEMLLLSYILMLYQNVWVGYTKQAFDNIYTGNYYKSVNKVKLLVCFIYILVFLRLRIAF